MRNKISILPDKKAEFGLKSQSQSQQGKILLPLLALICLLGGFWYFFGSNEGLKNFNLADIKAGSLKLENLEVPSVENLRIRSSVEKKTQELLKEDLRITKELVENEKWNPADLLALLDKRVAVFEEARDKATGDDAAVYGVLARYSKAVRDLWGAYLSELRSLQSMRPEQLASYRDREQANAIRRQITAIRQANQQLAGFHQKAPELMEAELIKAGVSEKSQEDVMRAIHEDYEQDNPYFQSMRSLDNEMFQLLQSFAGWAEARQFSRNRVYNSRAELEGHQHALSVSAEAYIERLEDLEAQYKTLGREWIEARKSQL